MRSRLTPKTNRSRVNIADTIFGPRRCAVPNVAANPRRLLLRKLREDWPATPITLRRPGFGEVPVTLFTTHSGVLADLLRQHLECRGVACQLSHAEQINPTSGARTVGAVHLTVWSEDRDLGSAIINASCPRKNRANSLD